MASTQRIIVTGGKGKRVALLEMSAVWWLVEVIAMVGVRGNGAYNTEKYPIQTPPSMLHQGSEFTARVPVGAAAWRTMLTMGRRKSQKGSTANDPRQTEVSRVFLLSSFIINLTWMQRNLRPGRREFRRGNVGRLLPPDSIGRTQDVSMMTQIPLIPSG